MSSTLKLTLRGTVSSRGEAAPLLKAPGDAVLVERGRPRLLLLSCPCGCGEQFPINLDPRAGPAWRLYRGNLWGFAASSSQRNALSLFPSVWRESGCRSHYIIWHDKIYLFGRGNEEVETSDTDLSAATEDVYKHLSSTELTPFAHVADALNAVPWDVLTICRKLVRDGRALEGKGKQQGHFCKK